MTLRETILSVRHNWDGYREKIKTAKDNEVYKLVVEIFPEILSSSVKSGRSLIFKGSTGAGNITKAPWIATFDPAITKHATEGFYVVYLFSVDMQRLYLSLAFGTTQFGYFKLSERHRKLRESARHLQALLKYPRPVFLDALDLSAKKGDRLHADYEQSNIAAIEYDLNDLPGDGELIADYAYMLELYRHLVRHPLLPDLQQLFEAVVEPEQQTAPEVKPFAVREAIEKRKGAGGKRDTRRSKVSKKVGDRGEDIVFNYEREKLASWGLDVNEVRWLAREGETPGWDITSMNQAGEKIFIEVKSSVGSAVSGLIVTANEWQAAVKYGASYHVYVVTNAMHGKATIEIIQDPAKLVEAGHVTISEAAWALSLYPATVIPKVSDVELIEER
ncbi:MrcB family domain-containing protein [Rhizobium sp. SL42]|uniref:MrcB family domain-containing protein n=1 Tax=Rhizobium sp. SL42 TaxID=2806346 RepID=UPI001F31228F|nr:DUF3578 domain-containing protein [Rhizobium sp. SL42]UJW75792.1 DUF3578 domain-containing protein [Rhizobium sp. SL42]